MVGAREGWREGAPEYVDRRVEARFWMVVCWCAKRQSDVTISGVESNGVACFAAEWGVTVVGCDVDVYCEVLERQRLLLEWGTYHCICSVQGESWVSRGGVRSCFGLVSPTWFSVAANTYNIVVTSFERVIASDDKEFGKRCRK